MVEPVEKRRKVIDSATAVVETSTKPSTKPSNVFSPFRVLGNVSNDIPFAIGTLGSTFYVVTSVGRSFQIYDVSTLHLLFISQTQTTSKITALAAHYHYVFAAYGNNIGIYKRGKLEDTLQCPTEAVVNHIVTFGEFVIASTTAGELFTFKRNGKKYPSELHSSLYTVKTAIHGDIVGIVHPPTYLNKIVVATTQHLFIFNVSTGKVLFQSPEGQFEGISAIESAPALDIIAVGTVNGAVYLHNVKKGRNVGKKIVAASEETGTKVVSLSFRTDGSPHLVAGLSNGDLFFYELEKRTRIHVLKGAHKESYGGISNAKFLNGQSIVVTNGGDNSLKEFVFDPTISTTNTSIISPPRHLRSRGGHSAPPVKIEFPQESKSHFILSASSDRSFWSFSLRKDAQAQEMSQRAPKPSDGKRQGGQVNSMKEKFTEIISIASNQTRAGDWENIITGHKEEAFARTWDSQSKRVGRHHLKTVDDGLVSCVGISHCGNFALVGSANGGIGSYNLQSGNMRRKYMLHKKAITGLGMDGMNQKMVSGGLDGIVGFYNFSKSTFLGKLDLESPITSMVYHQNSDLVACALDDLSIVIVDAVTQRVVRILYGHSNRITDMDFSPDGRWVVSVSLDGSLRTWDLPTGGCIDGVWLPSVATSVKFSPIGDMLATTHVTGNGIFLWTNRAQFRPISTRHVEEAEFSNILLPNTAGDGGASLIEGALDVASSVDDDDVKDTELNQLDESLVTMSLGPRSKYNTLLHLDVIKQRSRPKEAPKKPTQAPFFLSLKGEIVGDTAVEDENGKKVFYNNEDQQQDGEHQSKLMDFKNDGTHNFESEFTKLLREGAEQQDYSNFLEFVVNLPPATTDLEIRSINGFPPLTEMSNFISALAQGLATNKNYEIYQALYAMFLKNHGDVVYNYDDAELVARLDQFNVVNKKKEVELDELSKYCSGVVDVLLTM